MGSYSTHVTISRQFYEIAPIQQLIFQKSCLFSLKPQRVQPEEDLNRIEKSVVVATYILSCRDARQTLGVSNTSF